MPQRSLSADCLFHFTDRITYLESILRSGFHSRYALEDWSDFLGVKYRRAIPMVSFCDIPLAQIHQHTDFYGKYALGLRKDWGKRNSLCPIIYSYSNSFSSNYLSDLMRVAQNYNSPEIVDQIWKLLRFFKPYDGQLPHPHSRRKVIRFYDEREWRYVPDIKLRGEEFSASLSEEEYLDKKRLKRENKKLEIERFTLAFTPRDVKYIIVRSENEIGRMVYTINNLIVPASARSYLKVLTTRIISVEQIKEDF